MTKAVVSSSTPSRDVDLSAAVAVNDGRRLLGWLRTRLDRFEAITTAGRSLGLYNDQRAAWRALAAQEQVGV